jgi:hypothetical protein
MSIQPILPASPLVGGKLNVVGEDHAESGARRRLEKVFVADMTGDPNCKYWTEADFPDLRNDIPGRKKKAGTAQADPAADLMEFRAVHGVSMLIASFDTLCDVAARVAAITDNRSGKAIALFLTGYFTKFVEKRKRIVGTWEPTLTPDVNSAVNAVYAAVGNALVAYVTAVKANKHDVAQLRVATQALASNRGAVDALLDPLLAAVGVPHTDDPGALATEMRKQRSAAMGIAAHLSSQTGVWKVGNRHVKDLQDEEIKVDMSKANYVTKDDFNQAFNAWKIWKAQQLQQRKLQLQQQQLQQQRLQQQQRSQQRPQQGPRQPNI